jgi:hypothetical protein
VKADSIRRIRRVVTGENDAGRAVFASVSEVEPLSLRSKFYGVWGWDSTPPLPHMPSDDYVATSIHPPPDGVRVNVVEFPAGLGHGSQGTPASVDDLSDDERAAFKQFERLLFTEQANYTNSPDVEKTGLHRTQSLDICFVLDGKMVMALDDGAEEVLERGDIFVQNGTMHEYRNPFDEPCIMGIVVLPTTRPASGN